MSMIVLVFKKSYVINTSKILAYYKKRKLWRYTKNNCLAPEKENKILQVSFLVHFTWIFFCDQSFYYYESLLFGLLHVVKSITGQGLLSL